MSDAGDSTHKRSKSAAALSLLRRNHSRSEEDPSTTDDGAPLTSPPSTAASATNISMAQNVPRGNGANRLSISPSMGRTPSHNSPPSATASTSASKMSVAGSEKGVSLEQSVRKFRIVEALRSGDTASISKAIRDTAEGGPRTSISSINTLSGTGLDDTTVLHLAIQCAEYPVVEYVLSDGAGTIDINARDKDGNTPLHVAAVQGRTQVVKLLLDQKEINDAIANYQGRLPIDVARNPDIFQLLQLSRSIFAENKVRQIQGLIAQNDYKALETVLEESRLKQILDINSTEFVTEPTTLQAGGNLLHEAARKKNTQLIQVLLLHGADPFRRDRKGKLPQDVTKDDTTRAMLKRSPAAVAAQRGIQEKAVLGQAASQGAGAAASADPVAGKEAREMKGYLKKWTNYRKGYQLRWFVLEDGVLSYYKHQDDAGSACRGAINTRIAKLHMSADEKTKFEIIGKSSVKYTLKANHEVEAKRWFWALNNSIQWTKDQAKEEERQRARGAELLRQAKAEQSGKSPELSINEAQSESASVADGRSSVQIPRTMSHSKMSVPRSDFAGASTVASNDDDFADAATDAGQSRVTRGHHGPDDDDDDDDFEDVSSREEPSVSKDAFSITAQSAKLQLDTISAVNAAMLSEASKNPNTIVSDTKVTQALTTYDAAVRSLTGLIGDLMRISKDRDAYWQYRLDREIDMRRMWEESMAKVAKEQEILEERVDQAEQKRKAAKRALREVMNEQPTATSQDLEGDRKVDGTATVEAAIGADDANIAAPPAAPERTLTRKKTVLDSLELSDSESDDEDEFFDAVDAGEVEVSHLPHADAVPTPHEEKEEQQLVVSGGTDLSSSFKGYENGIRSRLKMDADDRPKISLWGILKSMIGKDMTKMTLPVSFNEPTSLLYRAGEDMEYVDLLDQAVERSDSIERLIYVAAFAASEYASTVGRVAKPFNPLLGETFEYVRPDKNYRFFIEQVSHHPPVGAAWAESPHWTYWGESAVKTKFYGKSFDANPLGTWFLKLRPKSGGKEDLYTWRKVTTSVIGIITGNPTVDNYGPMEVKNWTTGEVCQIEFQPRGWKASSAYKISGKVLDSDGRVRYSMGGRWNSKLYARLTPGYEATVEDPGDSASLHKGSITDPNKAFLIWQANPRPPGIPFNLTPFVLTFNHIDDKLKPWLPPTDSRLRPDQRAMEDGEYDFAAEEKNRLEEAQRARRKQREEKGIEFRPAWFEKTTCEITGEEYWKFNGKYWQQREKAGPEGNPQQAWEGLEPIYEDAK
ncbi:oxysterol-binding protein [Colletotrichum costaricense]|uniref:Oxysterol-binding protein n=2 Tax=Colletotrichum acutatum species complex TaxID=2707335 RepID=A0AAI9ZAZ6_9PEZI|nr:oxysterol-binding protein [Colletotrichum costaricense]XP_060382364.1 oxysterol-binding protein [Colletotrichum tamarilloi]KAK1499642.1 oxysterol-binding protein [Colletotrichum tamarilloi]KAK1540163.1 oxysterol-binding protein [Colletotrichum costaricense]